MRFSRSLVAGGVTVLCLTVLAAPALAEPAADAGHALKYSCTIDSVTHVQQSTNWLRVHTSPAVGAPAVGQLPGGARFDFCSSSGTTSGGHYWVYGFGYNGSTKLTGWVAGEYLVWP